MAGGNGDGGNGAGERGLVDAAVGSSADQPRFVAAERRWAAVGPSVRSGRSVAEVAVVGPAVVVELEEVEAQVVEGAVVEAVAEVVAVRLQLAK